MKRDIFHTFFTPMKTTEEKKIQFKFFSQMNPTKEQEQDASVRISKMIQLYEINLGKIVNLIMEQQETLYKCLASCKNDMDEIARIKGTFGSVPVEAPVADDIQS